MERQIGEVFEFEGKKIKVVKTLESNGCVNCCLKDKHDCDISLLECRSDIREDKTPIIFMEV